MFLSVVAPSDAKAFVLIQREFRRVGSLGANMFSKEKSPLSVVSYRHALLFYTMQRSACHYIALCGVTLETTTCVAYGTVCRQTTRSHPPHCQCTSRNRAFRRSSCASRWKAPNFAVCIGTSASSTSMVIFQPLLPGEERSQIYSKQLLATQPPPPWQQRQVTIVYIQASGWIPIIYESTPSRP